MKDRIVVEWAPFRLAEGVPESRLLAASHRLQEAFLARQPGFVRRELLRGGNGDWADLVWWADRKAADDAMKAAAESPVCHSYFHLMAGAPDAGNGVLHFARVASYVRS